LDMGEAVPHAPYKDRMRDLQVRIYGKTLRITLMRTECEK
jgi:hypothetical protein